MKFLSICKATFLAMTAFALSSCATARWGPGHYQKTFHKEGKLGGYLSYTDLRRYDGDLVQFDVWNDSIQNGEIINMDLWPIGGIGLGGFGMRGHLGPIGGGIGTLWYIPDSVGKGTVNSDRDLDFLWE